MKSPLFANLYSYFRVKGFNPQDVVLDSDGDVIQFTVPGFSKSGTATLKLLDVNGYTARIEVSTRYDTVKWATVDTEYQAFQFISSIAWGWYLNYKDRGYGIPEVWKEHWLSEGYIKKVVREEYVLKRSIP